MTTFKFKRGDAFTTTINIKDSSGTGLDITGATVFFTMRDTNTPDSIDDTDAVIAKTITSHDTPGSGVTSVTFTSDDTDITPGEYYREVQVKFASGSILSTITGEAIVEQDLTKSTS